MPEQKKPPMLASPKMGGSILIWILVLAVVLIVSNFLGTSRAQKAELSYTEFLQKVNSGKIAKVHFKGKKITGKFVSPEKIPIGKTSKAQEFSEFALTIPFDDSQLPKDLAQNAVEVSSEEDGLGFWAIVLNILPWLLIPLLYFLFIRQMQGSQKGIFAFGKSRARRVTPDKEKITFDDVAGCDEAKYELSEIIEFLRNPSKFSRLGGRIPGGVLLLGPPGTGKTLLAKAVAGEADVPFFSISGSDFVEMFVGVGASRVRDLFEEAKQNAPCIIFIDEIDAVGRWRGAGIGGGHDEREQTLNQLLVEMDGFDPNEGIIVTAATNRPDVLDTALLRPGRFDRRIVVDQPDIRGRIEILKVHTRKKPLAENVDLETVAKRTPGLVGADLENIVNEAALIAARSNKSQIEMDDFEAAMDKTMMGLERKSLTVSDDDKKITAYHESGHALVGMMLPTGDPIHKVSIIPRGFALGVTQFLNQDDKRLYTRSYLVHQLAHMLGGRAAELLVFGDPTTGAGNDLHRATEIAHRMVSEWGMSEIIGPVNLADGGQEVFLGKDLMSKAKISEKTTEAIDKEVRRLVEDAQNSAIGVLRKCEKALHELAQMLLERETVSREEIEGILARNDSLPSPA